MTMVLSGCAGCGMGAIPDSGLSFVEKSTAGAINSASMVTLGWAAVGGLDVFPMVDAIYATQKEASLPANGQMDIATLSYIGQLKRNGRACTACDYVWIKPRTAGLPNIPGVPDEGIGVDPAQSSNTALYVVGALALAGGLYYYMNRRKR